MQQSRPAMVGPVASTITAQASAGGGDVGTPSGAGTLTPTVEEIAAASRLLDTAEPVNGDHRAYWVTWDQAVELGVPPEVLASVGATPGTPVLTRRR